MGVHDEDGDWTCLTYQTGFLLADQAGVAGATELLLLLQPRSLPHIPRIVCVFPKLNPDPGSLPWDEDGVGWFLPCYPRFWGLG